MNSRKRLLAFVLFAVAGATSSFAQVYWSNQSPAGVADDIWCVTYANGTFAAVTNQGNILASTDGLTWSRQAIDQGVWLVSIAYGNGTWVAVGDKGSILLSSDLKTWIIAKSVTTNKLNGVLYTGSIWIAVGEVGTIVTSTDAQNWTLQPAILGVTGFLHGITYGGPLQPVLPGSPGDTLVSGQNGVLLVGTASGQSFSLVPSGTAQNLEAVLEVTASGLNNGGYTTAAVGGNGTALLSDYAAYPSYEEDGPGPSWSHWGPATLNSTVIFRGLAYGNGFFVAAGEQGTIFTSTDGKTWVQRFSGDSYSTLSTATLLGATYSPTLQRFVVVGTGGTILVSNPAPTVFANVSTRGYVSNSETFIGGFVIEGSAPRTILIRADGPVLSAFSVPGPLADPVLKIYDSNQKLVATNAGWATNSNPETISTAALKAGAFALPNPSLDSAVLLTLQPGAYTAVITSAAGNSGIALFEAYTD